MTEETLDAMPPEKRFEQLLTELLQAEERGECPDLSQLLRTAPDLKTAVLAFLRDRERFDRVAPLLAPTSARGTPPEAQGPPGRFGGYAVLKLLGRGAHGIVYRVRDPELNRPLAVKVLRPELRDEPGAVSRFLEEAQVMGQLQHPGIVPVHGLGQLPDGRPYFVMKLVEGRTLADLLGERPDPADDLPRFLAIFQQVCQAVAYAHSRGVIHRDLKPLNVMVGAFAEVQVMDWGLAKVLTDEASRGCQPPEAAADLVCTVRTEATGLSTAYGTVVGTFAYMAPEQARGQVEELDRRVDVFGLGAILCQVLTGLPPYCWVPALDLHRKAAAGDLADAFARLKRCGADAELIALGRDCLAPKRERRPRDAGAVADRLATHLAEIQKRLRRAELDKAAAQARAEEARATARAERRARRLTGGLAAAVLALVTALTAGGVWLQRQQAEEARQAKELAEAPQREAAAALEQAIRLCRDGLFDESRELLERAKVRLGTDGPADLRERVDQALADTRLTSRFDAACQRMLAETVVLGSTSAFPQAQRYAAARLAVLGLLNQEKSVFAQLEREYAAALQEAGLVLKGDEPRWEAERVRASPLAAQMVAALYNLALITPDQRRQEWLLDVARAADSNPQWDRVRELQLWQGGTALAARVREAPVAELSPSLVLALGGAIAYGGGDALPLLRKAQTQNPNDVWLRVKLGWELHRAKQSDEAIGHYRAALRLRPRAAVVHNNLGVILYDRGRHDEAIGHWEEAVRLEPRLAEAHTNLSKALYDRGRHDEAIRHYGEALRIDPGNDAAHNLLRRR
jgi:serine/threonine-protein kinase